MLCLWVVLPIPVVLAVDYADPPRIFETYDTISASTGGTLLDLGDNEVSDPIALGFSINYYGTEYTTVTVSANGMIGFDPVNLDTAALPPIFPDAGTPNAVIAPLASDLDPSAGGSIYTRAAGAAGQRYFVVEWIGVPVAGQGGSRSFAVVLYEDNGDILFQYRTLRGGAIINDTTTTVGIENPDGSLAVTTPASGIAEGRSVLFYGAEPDTDSDGMLDRFENFFGLDPETDDSSDDEDGDGVSNLDEFQRGTRPTQTDTDGDGLSDGDEETLGTDPLVSDTDSDGIREEREDANQNGLVESDETDPALADTDGDDYSDAVEYTYGDGFGADPLTAAASPMLGYTVTSGSIQSAINSASAGDILYMPPGEHSADTSLSVDRAITLIGAGADLTTLVLPGGISITGVDGSVLAGFTIRESTTAPAIRIQGSDSSPTEATVVKVTLENCNEGVLISGAPTSTTETTDALLDQVTFRVSEAAPVGYGIRVENLSNAADQVSIRNATLSLTGGATVIIDNSRAVTVSGSTLSSANGAGLQISDGTNITVDNNAIRSNFGDGVQVGGASTGINLNRNTVDGNSGRGILVADAAEATITDNLITSNEIGIESTSSGTVTNSGNSLSGNTTDYVGSLNQNESAASAVGATSAGKQITEAAAWIVQAAGGTAAVLDPPLVLVDLITSVFGTSVTLPAGAISADTRVTISETRESLPALPIAFDFAMPVVTFELQDADLTGTATITLPVLASFDTDQTRVFQLSGNSWQEIKGWTKHDHGQTAVHQQISFETQSLGTFALVLDLPVLDPGDPGGGGGCALAKGRVTGPTRSAALDGLLGLVPLLYLMRRRIRHAAKGHPAAGE